MWRALRRGDPRGLEELMSRYTPYVAAVAARVLPGRPQDWEELTADVFLSAWEHRKAPRPEQVLALEEDVLCLAEDGPQRLLEEREQAELVRRALGELERPDRELFVRHYYYGQTVARAAEEMGLNPSTAKTRLRRGREKLKEHLRKAGFCVEEAEDLIRRVSLSPSRDWWMGSGCASGCWDRWPDGEDGSSAGP